MALLDVDHLTMRFGGLTAVRDVDLRIEKDEIFSVIGPNGAGKTTVFNAVTGIYEPTAGAITFQGRKLLRPFTLRTAVMCALVGIGTGLAACALSSDVDGLWSATIKRNYDFAAKRFDAAAAWKDLWGYLAAKPAVERQPRGRWAVVAADGETLLGSIANKTTRDEAEQLRNEVTSLVDSQAEIVPVARDGRWAVMSSDGQRVLADYGAESTARRVARRIGSIAEEGHRARVTEWIALAGGLVLGLAGTLVIWNRTRHTPDVIALAGIARTFQNIRLFSAMTVLENVMVGLDRVQSGNPLRMALRTPGIRREEAELCRKAMESLRFVGLESKRQSLAGSLAYGDQRRLEIARALATGPKLLLLDEPAAGMNPAETVELMELVRRIRQRGITVLLIEHHMNVVMGISDRVAVLDYGEKIAEGSPDRVRRDPKVIEAYLGKEAQSGV